MRSLLFLLVLTLFLPPLGAGAGDGDFRIDKKWGDPAPYGDGRHPGIDYAIKTGTPILAASPGKVRMIRDSGTDGFEVAITHGHHFITNYAHLSKILVKENQYVGRGHLIALSGESNSYNKPHYEHLHFGTCKIGQGCLKQTDTFDPDTLWLGGTPQCFDPARDYAVAPQHQITLPVSCAAVASGPTTVMAGDRLSRQDVEALIVGKTLVLNFLTSGFEKTGQPQFAFYDRNGRFVKTTKNPDYPDFGTYEIRDDGSHCYRFENKNKVACWLLIRKENRVYFEHKKALFIAEVTFEDGNSHNLTIPSADSTGTASDPASQ